MIFYLELVKVTNMFCVVSLTCLYLKCTFSICRARCGVS
jgi:hypothetical protein